MKSPIAVAIAMLLLISCMTSTVIGKDALLMDENKEPLTTTRLLAVVGPSKGMPKKKKVTKTKAPTKQLTSREDAVEERSLKGVPKTSKTSKPTYKATPPPSNR